MNMQNYLAKRVQLCAVCLSFVVLLLLGCNLISAKELSLPVTSAQIVGTYTHDSILEKSALSILPEYQKQAVRFTEQETRIPVKGDHFGVDKVNTDIAYVEVGRFNIENNLYKIIVYNRIGEADTPLFNTQLNSYDSDGTLIDALLLDSRFSYEEFKRFSEFRIDRTTIEIDGFVIYTHAIVDGGEIGEPLANPTPQEFSKSVYQIDDGYFKLLSHTEMPHQ